MKKIKGLLVMTVALFMVTGFIALGSIKAEAANIPVGNCTSEEWKVIKLVNKERVTRGLKPLSTFTKLQKAADIRAKELDTLYSHKRPNGKTDASLMVEVGIKNEDNWGENIAQGHLNADDVMYGYFNDGWMYSSGHKAAILNIRYAHIGVGYYNPPTSNPVNWVQMFLSNWECGDNDSPFSPQKTVTISVKDGNKISSYKKGTSIDSMNRVLEVKCGHGTSYVPIITEMCKGYKKNSVGEQTIKVAYGSKSVTFKVNIKGSTTSISNATVSSIKNKTYNGKAQKPSPKVALEGVALKKNTDYTVSYKNNKNAGTATITIKGIGKYSGSIKKEFKIKKLAIKNTTVSKVKTQSYTGKAVKPKVTVTCKGISINKADYRVTYKNNVNEGTATVIVRGKGNLTGTATKTFKIEK